MLNILSNLTSSMYRPGEVILKFGEPVLDLVVVSEGKCNLYKKNSATEKFDS